MGQAPVCSFCSENEKDISLNPQLSKPQIIMPEFKSPSQNKNDPLILKGKHDLNSFKLTYIGG